MATRLRHPKDRSPESKRFAPYSCFCHACNHWFCASTGDRAVAMIERHKAKTAHQIAWDKYRQPF